MGSYKGSVQIKTSRVPVCGEGSFPCINEGTRLPPNPLTGRRKITIANLTANTVYLNTPPDKPSDANGYVLTPEHPFSMSIDPEDGCEIYATAVPESTVQVIEEAYS